MSWWYNDYPTNLWKPRLGCGEKMKFSESRTAGRQTLRAQLLRGRLSFSVVFTISIVLMLKKDCINEKLCSDEDAFPMFCIFFVFSVCQFGLFAFGGTSHVGLCTTYKIDGLILKSDTTLCWDVVKLSLTVGQSIISCLQRRKGHQGCRNDSGRKRDWCRRWKFWNFEKFLCAF